MSKKIMLLALAVVSAAILVVPSMAMAEDEPLHMTGTFPLNGNAVSGGASQLTTSSLTVKSTSLTGTANFESGTTGTMTLKFENVTGPLGVSCKNVGGTAGIVETTTLPFHLLTVNSKPGILVTGNGTARHFATFECAGVVSEVTGSSTGNGVVGTVTAPACSTPSTTATVKFEGTAGVQAHKTVNGTTTEYHLVRNGTQEAAMSAEGKVTFTASHELQCT